VGNEYIMSGNDNRDNPGYNLSVSLVGAARVFMLIDNRLQDGDNLTPPTFGPANTRLAAWAMYAACCFKDTPNGSGLDWYANSVSQTRARGNAVSTSRTSLSIYAMVKVVHRRHEPAYGVSLGFE